MKMWFSRVWEARTNGRIKNFVGGCIYAVFREISVLDKNASRYIWGVVPRFDPRPPSSISTNVLTFFRHILMHHSSLRISNSWWAPVWGLFFSFLPSLYTAFTKDDRYGPTSTTRIISTDAWWFFKTDIAILIIIMQLLNNYIYP